MSTFNTLDEYYASGLKSFQEAFPPVCITPNWDPTLVSSHVLPQTRIGTLREDPRQAVRICTSYYSSAPQDFVRDKPAFPLQFEAPPGGIASEQAYKQNEPPKIPVQLLGPSEFRRPESGEPATPPGGAAGLGAPYEIYAQSIDRESDLYRLDEKLTRCKEYRYKPGANMPTDSTNEIANVSQAFSLSPYATVVQKTAGCREADDEAAWNRSGRLFFNHTRLDRVYPKPHGPLACGNKVV